MGETHVVVGGTGAIGAAIVRRLVADGLPTRAVVRRRQAAQALLPANTEIAVADAADPASLAPVFDDAAVVYHCVNVPYPMWQVVMPRVTTNVLEGTREAGARLVFPGNVYGLGRFRKIPAPEGHPPNATSDKGKLRNSLEQTLLHAHQQGQVPVVIPRLPDFYGPNVTNALYGALFEAALAGRKARWLGKLDVPHDFVFIDDAAAACVRLAASESAYGEVWNVPGAGPLTAREFIRMIFQEVGAPPRLGTRPGWMIRVAGFFNATAREIAELVYLFDEPQVLDGSKLAAAFPDFGFTPHREAVAATVAWFRDRTEG